MTERLHPQSAETLRQLIKLHGADLLVRTIRELEMEQMRQELLKDPKTRIGAAVLNDRTRDTTS